MVDGCSHANNDGNLSVPAAWPSKVRGDAHQQTSPLCFDVRTDEREDRTSCLLAASGGNAVWAGVWERQSQQQEAQQGAEGLLGRMQAKGIVGNYTGLERASNALIQQDIFIKKRGCWTGTKRASERVREQRRAPLDSSGLECCTAFCSLCGFCTTSAAFCGCLHVEREAEAGGSPQAHILPVEVCSACVCPLQSPPPRLPFLHTRFSVWEILSNRKFWHPPSHPAAGPCPLQYFKIKSIVKE